MTEIGEMVAVAKAAPHTDDDCPFCRTEEEIHKKNYLEADFDEDKNQAGNATENHSGTLAKNLVEFTGQPKPPAPPQVSKPTPERASELDVHKPVEEGEERPFETLDFARAEETSWHERVFEAGKIPMLYGAHHLIPGNDSMAKSVLYKQQKLGPVDNGEDPANIGYNINSANNGVWLTANYAVSGWGKRDAEFQKAYAFLAMHDTGRQFHDSHQKPYSITVRKALNEVNKLLNNMEDDGCPFCGQGEKASEPPYHLNARLNAISRWLKGHLMSEPNQWRNNIVTSRWCKKYKEFVQEETDPEGELERMRTHPPKT